MAPSISLKRIDETRAASASPTGHPSLRSGGMAYGGGGGGRPASAATSEACAAGEGEGSRHARGAGEGDGAAAGAHQAARGPRALTSTARRAVNAPEVNA